MTRLLAVLVAVNAAFAAYDFAVGRPVAGAFSVFVVVACLLWTVTP